MLSSIWAVNQTSRGRYLIKKPARQHNSQVHESNFTPIETQQFGRFAWQKIEISSRSANPLGWLGGAGVEIGNYT